MYALSGSRHRRFYSSFICVSSLRVLRLIHGLLYDGLGDHLMVLKRSELIQLVTLDLMVRLIVIFVYLNICDGIWIV